MQNEVKQDRSTLTKLAAGTGLATIAGSAMADYATLAGAVDWSDVGAALFAVGAAIIGIMVVFKGIKLVTKAVKSA